jgi:hypothetical protein
MATLPACSGSGVYVAKLLLGLLKLEEKAGKDDLDQEGDWGSVGFLAPPITPQSYPAPHPAWRARMVVESAAAYGLANIVSLPTSSAFRFLCFY